MDVDGSLHYNTMINPAYIDFNEQDFRLNTVKRFTEDFVIDLEEHTRKQFFTPQLLVFFNNFIEEGSFIPNNFLT